MAEHGRNWLVAALGLVIALIGLVLIIGGVWLVSLEGSAYYGIAGLGLLAAGALLIANRMLGAGLYLLVYAGTIVWAFWEAGPDLWALVPRVVAPSVLAVLVLLSLPALRPRRFGRGFGLAGAAACVGLVAIGAVALYERPGSATAAPLPDAGRLAMTEPSAEATGADWPVYAGTRSARSYSPLDQITPANVDRLERAWVYHTRDMPAGDPAESKYGAETTPLKIGDTLYLCSATNVLIALDAATGEERWRHDPEVGDDWIPYTAACRGVAYYEAPGAVAGEACAARVIEGTLDGRLIAVDAATGVPCPGFGTDGAADIKVGMGAIEPGMVSMTSPPTIVRGVVVTGHQVLDGQKNDAPSGVIQGFDAVTGEHLWAWDLGKPDLDGRPPEGEIFTRGTPNMWTIASGDEALGHVYLPMGNSAVDYWSSDRSEAENTYSTSLVAIDVTTGDPVWHFQTVHKDVWDYDLGSQGTLVDFPTEEGTVPALILPSKQGDLYILDRRTGTPLTPVEERPVPGGGVEPAERAPTQPFSGYHTLAKQRLTEADMWGMSPIDQMICRIQFREATYEGIYTPPTVETRWIQYPGYNGGSDWGGIAVDPTRGVIVANYNDMPNYNRLVPRAVADALGWAPRGEVRGGDMGGGAEGAGDPQAGTPFAIDVNAGWRLPYTGLLCKEPPYGGIRAIDLPTGETLWDRPLGQARKNGPFGIPSMLPVTIGTPNNGGPVVTAGGLVFIAAATDDLIRAIDLSTGETVWTDELPAGGQATPMTYAVDGRQYVVIMAGGHHFMETPIGDALIAYALPE